MKKTLLIIAGLLVVALLSCNAGKKSGSSLVTITVGSNKTASLSIQQATLYARLKNFLADHLQVRSAEALMPSNVASIQVTVWASDMPAIAQTIDTTGVSSVTIIIEVPNGLNRLFAITGFDTGGNITYAGGMSADLNGTEVFLPMPMINLGTVPQILYVSTSGNGATGDGTLQNPFRTISDALATVGINGNAGILIWPGTYDTNGGETFPFTLAPNTALACLGESNSVVIDDAGAAFTFGALINGATGASIDGCKITLSVFQTAIDDLGSPMTVNNDIVQGSGTNQLGVVSSGSTTIAKSTFSGFPVGDGSSWGIQINGGNPTVSQCTINIQFVSFIGSLGGINITGGSPLISGNTINAGSYGIEVSGGSPTISGNKISNATTGYGIYLYASVSPPTATISGNTIAHNGYGIYASSAVGSSFLNNSIFCNSTTDFYLADLSASGFNLSGNAWDHALVSGPTITSDSPTFCSGGVDICYSSSLTSAPTFSPFNAAVPGGCP